MKRLDSVPISKTLAFSCVMLMAVIGLLYVSIWEPTQTQIDMVLRKIQQLDQEIQRDTHTTKELINLQAGVEELQKGLRKRGELAHQEDPAIGLRQHVMRLAKNHRLAIVSWRPGLAAENSQAGIKTQPVNVRVEGGYHDVAKFFVEVLHIPTITQINELTMRAENNRTGKRTLLTDFNLTTIEMSGSEIFPELVSSHEGPVF